MAQVLPPYVLNRNSRSRHIRLRVFPGGKVVVSAPNRVAEEVIESFLSSHVSWLVEKVEYFKKFPEPGLSKFQEKKLFGVYKQKAHTRAEEKIKQWNKHFGFSFNKISIRNSRTRWGSCSSLGTLSFNYKIIFLPEDLADYLVVHELCHLKEHNHGKTFWALVARVIPEYVLRRKELRNFEKTFKLSVSGV